MKPLKVDAFTNRALQVGTDRSGRVHISTRPAARRHIALFEQARRAFLRRDLDGLCAPGQAALAGIVDEGVFMPNELRRFLEALPRAVQVHQHVIVGWTAADGRRDERALGPRLRLLTPAFAASIRVEDALTALERWLVRFSARRRSPGADTLLVQLQFGACAWWHTQLPGSVYAHVARLSPMSAAAVGTWAREASGLALAPPPSDAPDRALPAGLRQARTLLGADARGLLREFAAVLTEGRDHGAAWRRQHCLSILDELDVPGVGLFLPESAAGGGPLRLGQAHVDGRHGPARHARHGHGAALFQSRERRARRRLGPAARGMF